VPDGRAYRVQAAGRVLLKTPLRVVGVMSSTSQISSHMLTPRWTHAIDVRAESRREDSISLLAYGLSWLAALRDQPVPMAPVPRADMPRRKTPTRQKAPVAIKGPTPLSVPQETDTSAEQQAGASLSAAAPRTDY
jgi:hypothetical protein